MLASCARSERIFVTLKKASALHTLSTSVILWHHVEGIALPRENHEPAKDVFGEPWIRSRSRFFGAHRLSVSPLH
jgi:hypothetical protein